MPNSSLNRAPHPKKELFEKFHTLFYRAFDEEGLQRHEVPYQSSHLAASTLEARAENSKGTVVIHGGFDSLIEEFYCFWDYFAGLGYDVIAFEGPGQEMTYRRFGLTLDHDWEKPVGAVLDHFGVDDATLLSEQWEVSEVEHLAQGVLVRRLGLRPRPRRSSPPVSAPTATML